MPKTDPITLDPSLEPWQQQPGESGTWFGRFCRYKLMGSSRSLLGLYKLELQEKARESKKKQPTAAPGSWYQTAKQFRWEERAQSWDYHYFSQQEHQYIAAWEEHRAALLDRAQRLMDIADRMIQQPIETGGWSFRDVPTYYEKATDLLRVAVGDDEWMIRQLQRRGYIVARTEEEADAIAEQVG